MRKHDKSLVAEIQGNVVGVIWVKTNVSMYVGVEKIQFSYI